MSRHRNIRNMNIEDEYDDYDDDYSNSYEDEPSMSPSAEQYLYTRPRLTSTNDRYGTKLSEFIPDEPVQRNHIQEEMFQMDDMHDEPTAPAPVAATKPVETYQQRHVVVSLPIKPTTTSELPPVPETSKPVLPSINSLRIGETPRSSSKSPSRKGNNKSAPAVREGAATPSIPMTSSTHRLNQLASIAATPATPRRVRTRDDAKQLINLVVVGHVDAGKSTLMGHLLVKMGYVDDRTMHKYKQESARSGKSSFAFAWVLDETEEERARGVTMDIGRTSFETDSKRVVLLDAPGHKDFIPNMITGAAQADAAILVVNATRGEFETGFENGGQTREHAMLLRSLGVGQVVVAVNKLDTVDWSQERFEEVKASMNSFLTKQAGFSKLRFVPVSGLSGENLAVRVLPSHALSSWYNGPSLLEMIESFNSPPRPADGPLRIVVNDVFKATTSSLSVSGKIESGEIEQGDKVIIMPNIDSAIVKACSNETGGTDACLAGDQVLLTLNGTFEPDTVHAGSVVVRAGPNALMPGKRFLVRIVVFDIAVPIMKGTRAELFAHSLCEPCSFVKLVSAVNKTTGEVTKDRPRCLSRGMSGIVEIECEHEVAIEEFTKCRALGRVTFRSGGTTLAAGIVEAKVS